MPKIIKLSIWAIVGLLAVFSVAFALYQVTELRAENEALTTDLGTTREQLATTEKQMADKTAENEALTTDLGTTREQLTSKTTELDTLLREVGQLEAVRNEKASLQNEIAQLQAQRAPLMVESYQAGFRCTGSMEPKITCLDEATWLANFKPQDIVIGAVISFPECYLASVPVCIYDYSTSKGFYTTLVAHRVIAIKVVDEVHPYRNIEVEEKVYYYKTKGDANSQDDGYWISQANVEGYIIELPKNVHLENQSLRDKVNAAKAALDQAEAALDQADAALEQADQNYLAHKITYAVYKIAYDAQRQAYAAYKIAYDAWRQAYNLALAGAPQI